MTFLTPGVALLVAGTLGPALLALYFLKLKRREVEVSTTLLWRRAIDDLRANAPLQRLRRNLLLLLQMLALLAGAAAMGQPALRRAAPVQGRVAILIDRSASMAAPADASGASRLARAKEQAIQFVRTLPAPGLFSDRAPVEAMVVAFDASAQVLQPFTSDREALERAIASIQQTDAPTRLSEALQLATATGGGQAWEDEPRLGEARIWSDGAVQDLRDLQAPPAVSIVWERVGDLPVRNVAITAFALRRALGEPDTVEAFVAVQTVGEAPRDVAVEIAVDGETVAVLPVAPRSADDDQEKATWTGKATFQRRSGALVSAQLLGVDDDLPVDDVAQAVLPPARRLRVALVTRGELFVRTALEGMPLAQLQTMTPEQALEQAQDPRAWGRWDVVVTTQGALPDPWLEQLPPGRHLLLGAHIPLDADATAQQPAAPVEWDRARALTRDAGFERLLVGAVAPWPGPEPVETLMTTDQGPGVLLVRSRRAEAIVTTFAPALSSWPFDPGFVVFLGEALRLLGQAESETAALKPGQSILQTLPAGARRVELTRLGAAAPATQLTPDASGAVAYGPIGRTGVYLLRWEGPAGEADFERDGLATRPIAVNLLDAEESDIRPARELAAPATTVRAGAFGPGSSGALRELWRWLLLASLATLTLEWWVYTRRTAL